MTVKQFNIGTVNCACYVSCTCEWAEIHSIIFVVDEHEPRIDTEQIQQRPKRNHLYSAHIVCGHALETWTFNRVFLPLCVAAAPRERMVKFR